MRSSHLFALAVVAALVAASVFLVGEPELEFAVTAPAPPQALSVSLTLPDEVVAGSEEALDNETEDGLSGEAEERAALATSTTTATTVPPTTDTTAAPAARTPQASSPSNSSATTAPPTTSAPPTTAAPTTTQPPPPPPSGQFRGDLEADFHGRINALRAANGKAALTRSGSLDSYARSWAKYMGDNGTLAHSNIGSLLGSWSAVAENVAAGGSVSGVWGALAGSGTHVANMLGDFTHVGIGVWVDGSGKLWTAHVFAR